MSFSSAVILRSCERQDFVMLTCPAMKFGNMRADISTLRKIGAGIGCEILRPRRKPTGYVSLP